MQYNVKLNAFEGPLDLLLHLINRLEIDIYDIPMAEITEQYMSYIQAMKELELDVASEYLVMAATLLAIKSKMLLPKQEELVIEDFPLDYEEDPRDELIEKLIEYRKFKDAALQLKELEAERSEIFTKPPSDLSGFTEDLPVKPLKKDVTIYDMLGALSKLLRRKQLQKPLHTRITRQEIPIERRMDEVLTFIKKKGTRVDFFSLFEEPDKESIVVTFLAILELMKLNKIAIEQENNFAELFIYSPREE